MTKDEENQLVRKAIKFDCAKAFFERYFVTGQPIDDLEKDFYISELAKLFGLPQMVLLN